MATTWLLTLLSVAGVSLVALVGLATLSLNESRLQRVSGVLISFAVGALLGDAFIHLVPESFADRAGSVIQPSLLILGGMLLFFLVEKLLRHRHGAFHQHRVTTAERPELATINVIGDAIHNFIDGVLIAASYLVSPELGLSTTAAVLLHEVPQELGDFGVLIHGGLSPRRAILVNVGAATAAFAGAAVTLLVGAGDAEAVTDLLLPVAAGGFVYIASADLIPELQRDHSVGALLVQTTTIALGIAVMALLTLVE